MYVSRKISSCSRHSTEQYCHNGKPTFTSIHPNCWKCFDPLDRRSCPQFSMQRRFLRVRWRREQLHMKSSHHATRTMRNSLLLLSLHLRRLILSQKLQLRLQPRHSHLSKTLDEWSDALNYTHSSPDNWFSCVHCSFSPASSKDQGSSETKSPAFLFSLNSDPNTPGFPGFGFDVGSSQEEVRNKWSHRNHCVGF